ncbi:MAG TPA: type II toxin-antitoxin system prevent-host-death family antitoxin [Acidimicrobiia bacterium]|nr:type II toxin-antitoxin system prevent-host-death family antitoxin [Acidimicrobiia bacterium]
MGNLEVSIRDLRNHGGEVIDRVAAGEHLTVTRSGRPVAELRPLPGARLKAAVVLAHWSRLPEVDPRRLRVDLDKAIDSSLWPAGHPLRRVSSIPAHSSS